MKLTIVILAPTLLAGCAPMTIGRINADPSRFQNRTVRVTGTVTNSVGLMGKGGYQLEDNTGRIYISVQTNMPPASMLPSCLSSPANFDAMIVDGAAPLSTHCSSAACMLC